MGIQERLEQEEKEAEKLLFGDDTEDNQQEQEAHEEAPSSEVPEDSPEEGAKAEEPESKPTRVSWKNRFTSYKATTDVTLRNLRVENAQLRSANEELRAENARLQKRIEELEESKEIEKDPFEGVVQEADVETLGPEAIEVLKKLALAGRQNSPEKRKLELLEKKMLKDQEVRAAEAKARAEVMEQDEADDFRQKLVAAIQDFEVIDLDQNFGEYLKGVDTASQMPRLHLYRQAIQSRDVLGVARFYNEYRETRPKSPEEFLEEQVVPEGDAAGPVSPEVNSNAGKKRYHISEYESFMDDRTKGKWRGREKEAIKLEKMFDKAFMEDRMDG